MIQSDSTLDHCRVKRALQFQVAPAIFIIKENKVFMMIKETCLHTDTFIMLNIFSLEETIGLKIWEKQLLGYAKYLLPVPVRGSKTLRS